jgi:hypothetical protein
MPDVITLAEQYSAALLKHDTAALNRIINAYGAIYQRLDDKITALTLEIGEQAPTAGQVARMARFTSLIEQTNNELTDFQGYLKTEVNSQARGAIGMGVNDAARLVGASATGDAVVLAGFNRLPTRAIEKLLGFLDPSGPLYARINLLAPTTADLVRQKILEGVGLGFNPKKIAAQIQNAFGQGLTDALRMTRTVQLYSYREAKRATYIANSDVVSGWYWFAHLSGNCCMSCVAQHGTFHSNTERLNDHYNGKCTDIPAVAGFDNPITQDGEAWFSQQDEAQQRSMMGAQYYQAWKGGAFGIGDLSKESPDDVYGQMRSVAPLYDLLGAEPPAGIK